MEFDKITLNNVDNIKIITELKYHKIISYSLGSIVIILIIIFIIYLYCKHKNIKIQIKNKIQENPKTKEGGVTLQAEEILEKYSSNE